MRNESESKHRQQRFYLSKLNISSAIADRLSGFMKSDTFSIHSSVAKTEYWRYFSDQLRTDVNGGSVEVAGHSGFYVPPPASVFTLSLIHI